jgi:repressor LexA
MSYAPGAPLTPRQHDCLAAIRAHIEAHARPPTRVDLARAMGITSTNGVQEHLDRLEAKGRIKRAPGKGRALTIIEPEVKPVDVDLGALDGARVHWAVRP